jgi:hypothetical protein
MMSVSAFVAEGLMRSTQSDETATSSIGGARSKHEAPPTHY